MTPDMVRIGVIGCGYWGPNLLRNFVEIPQSRVVAVAELREARRDYVRTRYPDVRVTAEYRDLFHLDLDGVVVATPPPTHYAIAHDCLQHGLHVLVEKPLTLNSDHAAELIAQAEAADRVLMVGHTFEYNPAVQALKQFIARGDLGEIFYLSTMRLNLGLFQSDLDVLWDLAPHDISILRYLLDADPLSVGASGASYIFRDVCDIAFLCFEFPNKTCAHSRVSWLDPHKVRQITVVGSEKMAVYDDTATNEKIRIYDKRVQSQPYTDTYGEFQLQYHHGDIVIPNIPHAEPLRQECEHFLHCIVTGDTPRSDGRSGWSVIKIIEAAERSLRNGNTHEHIHWASDTPVPLTH